MNMSKEKVCGVKLKGEKQEECSVAILGEELETFSTKDDSEIVERISEEQPSVVAFTNPLTKPKDKDFRDDEQELVEDGHSFLPPSMFDNQLIERTVYIKKAIQQNYRPQVIETRPKVSSDILNIENDRDLELLGIKTEDIETMEEFESVVAAITARKYLKNSCKDKGFIVPVQE